MYGRRASLPWPRTARTGRPAPARTRPSITAHPQQQHRDKRPRRDAVAIRTHRPRRIWELQQQLEPANGNHGLGLQEKGGSGYSSALSFNRRIIQHRELFFPKKFLAKFTDVRSCRDEKRADIIRSWLQGCCQLLGGAPGSSARTAGQSSSQQHPTHSTGHFLPALLAPPQALL